MPAEEDFEGFAFLELMGHRRLAGFVRIVSLAGIPTISIEADWSMRKQFYAPSALYCLTPSTEEAVREWNERQGFMRPALAVVADDDDYSDPLDETSPF